MSVSIKVDSRDLNKVHRRLNRLPRDITEGAQDAVKESGEWIRDDVATHVGVFRGRLKSRIRMRAIGTLGLTADVGWFDKDTYYAQFVEFGTSSITANPVLTRAGEVERTQFPRRVKKHIEAKL